MVSGQWASGEGSRQHAVGVGVGVARCAAVRGRGAGHVAQPHGRPPRLQEPHGQHGSQAELRHLAVDRRAASPHV